MLYKKYQKSLNSFFVFCVSESLSQLDADVCGQVPLSNRLLGLGVKVTDGKWPWMASLQKDGRHVCGGTLVNEDFVLSSADCFSSSATASDWTVVLGRLKQNGFNPFEVKLNVTDITLSNHTGSNEAALHLATPAPLSDSILPICVDTGRNFSVGSTCWVAGWSSGAEGVEQVLQEFQTSVVDCEDTSSDSICTEALTLEQGFSGGPLMCRQDDSWFLAGVLAAENKLTTGTKAVQGKSIVNNWLVFPQPGYF
ncbi:transmembrane protease serine 6-like [Channa argus]|uniref:transmembrane protease serine 6-like n=1 Tax=Channa argus TaxID=215402 RepID=UPI0035200B99